MGTDDRFKVIARALDAIEAEPLVNDAAKALHSLQSDFASALPDFFMSAPEPYFITDDRGVFLQANSQLLDFVKLTSGALRHKPMSVFIQNNEERYEFRKALNLLIPSQHISFGTWMSIAHRSHYVLLSGMMILDQVGERRILWLMRDLTEQKQLERALRKHEDELEEAINERTAELRSAMRSLQHANMVKDEFLALLSHELKTPLTVILGSSNLLRRYSLGPEEQDQILKDLEQEAHRLDNMVNNLMALARLDAQPRELEPMALPFILQDEVEKFCSKSVGRRIHLSVSRELPPVLGVETYFSQVMQNLLSNAAKYAPGTPIHVAARQRRTKIWVTVRDYGPGITRADAPHLFEAFFRSYGQKAIPGTGIGLNVCQRLVESQGGELLFSQPKGPGARFCFSLNIVESRFD